MREILRSVSVLYVSRHCARARRREAQRALVPGSHARQAKRKEENWLLIKAHDEWERSAKDPDILKQSPRSVVSDRSIEEIAEGKSRKQARRSTRAKAKA